VFRHPRRTVITAAAVALAVVFMTVAAGFLDFTFWGLRQSIVYAGVGHLQLLPVGDDADRTRTRGLGTYDRLGSDVTDGVRAVLDAAPTVEAVAPRLEFQGLVSAGPRTLAFAGIGVDPAAESRLRSLTLLTAGEWFTGAERMPHALVGSGLAQRLGVQPRDVVSLITYSDRGRMTAADVQIGGIFESGVVEYDVRTVLVPLSTARDLTEATGLSGIAVTLRDPSALDDVVGAVQRRLAGASTPARVARWDELSPVYASVVRLYQWILRVFVTIVTVIVVLGVANTMSMAVFERAPEVAVLRALGFGPGRIVAMFLLEATTIGLGGSAIGVGSGILACVAISAVGIEMPPPPGHTHGYVAAVHVVPRAIVVAAAIALGAAILAAVGPSLRSIRGEVADALRAT